MLVLDIQATQSLDHRDRGVARYAREVALAIERRDPSRVGALVLNPDLLLPGDLEPLVATGKLRYRDELDWSDVATLHVLSPYELAVPISRLAPPPGWSGRLIVTLFDLISEVLADQYLEDPGLRRRYRARHELVRQADLVLAISRSAAHDAVSMLGLDNERPGRRLVVTPLAPSSVFVPAEGGHRERYVLYTGGTDHRKNVEALLEAWGRLPEALERQYKLVLACSVKPLERNHYEVMADRLGFRDNLEVTGWLPEADMVRLTQQATLAVYPSLYEGYGLPVAEALACHTPAIASNTSSLPELLPPEALFDPYDVASIARAIERALTDSTHRATLEQVARESPRRTYDDVARETLDAYGPSPPAASVPAASGRTTGHGPNARLAFVTPLPPVPGGVSDYSFRMLEELVAQFGDHLTVDAYVDGPPHERQAVLGAKAPEGVTARPLASLERIEAIDGPYDHTVISLGNSEFHTGGLALLERRRGGVVLAHDVRLTNLYRFAAWQHRDADPAGFHRALHEMYPDLPVALGGDGAIRMDDADRWGVFMARRAIAASDRYLVTSEFAKRLAKLDALHADRGKVAVLPFSVGAVPLRDPTPADRRPGPPVVGSFGVVNDLKQGQALVSAFGLVRRQHPDAQLVFVGPVGHEEALRLRGDGVELTGELPEESYLAWLDRSWAAVQLRTTTNGESSGAVGDCLTAGVPTVVTAIGPARDLPGDAVVKVAAGASTEELAAEISGLLAAADRRRALGAAARRYADEHSFARAAAALYEVLVSAP